MSSVTSQTSISKFLTKIDRAEPAIVSKVRRKDAEEGEEKSIELPTEFSFPYQAYTIQQNLMKEVFRCIEEKKIGIFESPTGTGKSLSLLCASVSWLIKYEETRRQQLEGRIKEAEEEVENKTKNEAAGDWFESFKVKSEVNNKLSQLKDDFSKLVKIDESIKKLKDKRQKKVTNKDVYANAKPPVSAKNDIDDFLDEIQQIKKNLESLDDENQENLDQDLILKDYESDEGEEQDEGEEMNENDEINDNVTKIFYCSRTHSQLSQFVGEVKKTSFGEKIRVVTLSSRQNACLNDSVLKLKSLNAMNDRCLELQKKKNSKETKIVDDGGAVAKKKKISNGCQYFKQSAVKELQEHILAEVGDIEDIGKIGLKSKACPYYASRFAVPLAQLVVLPYNTLLNKQTREACGIKLKNNIVIIDEAHNLLSAISSIHSCEISGSQLATALSQLSQYKQRFMKRLKAKNLFYVQQIIFILQSLLNYLKDSSSIVTENKSEESVSVINLNELVIATKIDNLNLFKVLRYCKKSELSRKLLGFSEKYPNSNKKQGKSAVGKFLENLCNANKPNESSNKEKEIIEEERKPASSPLMQIEELFRCLTNSNNNGRIVIHRHSSIENCKIKYYLLNPAVHFQDVVSQARAVIVAGGTLQPIEEFTDQLFRLSGADMSRIMHFSCGHVIPSSHLLSISLAQGPGGQNMDFSFNNRMSTAMLDDVGRAILSVSNVVPGGIVCFFSSYSYAEKVIQHWENTKMLAKFDAKKTVFIEPRKGSEMNSVLDGFSKAVWESKAKMSTVSSTVSMKTGAILFCVVGGKMSEGINFSDDLGRCIIMLGMPYPNKYSAELQEKMKYLDKTLPCTPNGKMPGQLHYEHICMKAVNQSIGRAIRHRKDYATILLLDNRYCRLSVQQALPQWIQNQIKTCPKFGPAFNSIRKFFQDKKMEEIH